MVFPCDKNTGDLLLTGDKPEKGQSTFFATKQDLILRRLGIGADDHALLRSLYLEE